MNINIEKIENGFVVVIGSKRTFCSEAMGICGLLAEWAQSEVDRLEKGQTYGDAAMSHALVQAMKSLQNQASEITKSADDMDDVFKYMASPQVQYDPVLTRSKLVEMYKRFTSK